MTVAVNRPPPRLPLTALLFLALLSGGPWGLALGAEAVPTPSPSLSISGLPSTSEVEARIKEVESASGLDEAAKSAAIEQLRAVLSSLESIRAFDAKAADYAAALESAPRKTAELRQTLAAAGQTAAGPDKDRDQALSSAAISQRLGQLQTETARIESLQIELSRLLDGGTARRGDALKRLGELKQGLEQDPATPRETDAEGQPAQAAELARWVSNARQAALAAESRAIEQELASQDVREDLYRAQNEQAVGDLADLKRRRSALEALKVERSKAEAEQAIAETKKAEEKAVDQHPQVKRLAEQNSEITAALAKVADQLEWLNTKAAETERDRKDLEETLRRDRERIDAAGLNQALGQILMDRQAQLPDLRSLRKSINEGGERISEETLRQIRYREEQRQRLDLDAAVNALVADDPSAQSPQVRDQLKALLGQRKDLIERAIEAQEDFIRRLGELNYVSTQLIASTEAYAAFLDEHLLWVRSVPPVGISTLSDLPRGVKWLLSAEGWGEVGRVLSIEARQSPGTWLGLLGVAAILWRSSRIKRAIVAAGEPLRRVSTDAFRHTLKAIGLTLLAALPLSVVFVLIGRELVQSLEATPYTRAMGGALLSTAGGLYFLRVFRLLCIPGGVADRHFRWGSAELQTIRRALRWFTPFIIPVGALAFAVFYLNEQMQSASIGRLSLLLAMLGAALFFSQLFNPRTGVFAKLLADHPTGWANRLRTLWYPLVVGTPVALVVLMLFGFMYTAGVLFQALVQTAWQALALVLIQQTILRWLMLTRRRLALQAALERQATRRAQAAAESAKSKGTGTSELGQVEEPEVDLASLDEQTRKLVNALVLFGAVVALWATWSPMLPAFNMLDQFALWHYQSTVNGVTQLVSVSVADVALVLVILFVALVAAKNLPALIEIVLLQMSTVSAGTRFAVKTLMSYAIATTAFLMAFGTLGLSWSEVQWLVAALSVGIGFGLQEIVANFISGLIILFERPVRVGDVVTIGDTTGVVTNIQIRATTIRNWDRQELLVPNKEFITGRLLNWTLSDQVTRIVIVIGVEYGSDTELALTILNQVATQHKLVLKEPPPIVSFDGFGDNALTLTLRCFLGSVDQRISVTSELNRDIGRRFDEHGIVIAFPQRDIHLSTRDPIEIRLKREPRPRPDNGTDGVAVE